MKITTTIPKKFAFYGEHDTSGARWRWWEVGNYQDQFDVITTAEKDRRVKEYEAIGHEVFEGLPAFDEAAQERLDEIEAAIAAETKKKI